MWTREEKGDEFYFSYVYVKASRSDASFCSSTGIKWTKVPFLYLCLQE